MLKKVSAYPYIAWSLLFIIVPILAVSYYSLSSLSDGGQVYFTVENFIKFFSNPIYIGVLLKSLKIALYATLICLLLGYPMAMILVSMKPRNRNLAIMLFVLPMWMNFLIRTYAMMAILSDNGWLNVILEIFNLPVQSILYTEAAILLGMVYNFLPFMVLPIYTSLIKMDKGLIEASNDLGGNEYYTFAKVTVPLSIPGVISGITMVFMPAVSTFVISDLLGGGKIMLIGNLIHQQFLLVFNWYFGSAISIILMIIILVLMTILNKYSSEEEERGGLSI